MIKDLRIHGLIDGDKEFFATLCGDDLDIRYFHEVTDGEGSPKHRFFLSGSEFLLEDDGITHIGNGGSFCPYMFGVDEPIEDLVKPEVINRLVVFGVHNIENGSISITGSTDGKESFRQVFLRGHAVFNYFFFIRFTTNSRLKAQQEDILRVLGRSLKRYPLNIDADDSRVIEELKDHWTRFGTAFFLLKIVNRSHLSFYNSFQKIYAESQTIGDDEMAVLDQLAADLGVDPYAQERMKIDVMYRHPDNRQVVEEYRAVLSGVRGSENVSFDDRARISRLRTVALRKGIPVNLLNSLDEKLLENRKILATDDPAYLVEVRGVLESIFLQSRHVGVHIETEDLIKLLKSKFFALDNRDSSFDRILIEVGKQCDEISRETGDASILEEFGQIVTFFDRFDAIYHMVNGLGFHQEEKLPEEKLRSLLLNKKIFDNVQEGLFKDLFIETSLGNNFLPWYGRRKVEALSEGLIRIETGDRSLQDLMIEMEDLVREEREYRLIKTAMDRWLKKFGRSLKGAEEEGAFVNDVRKMMVSRGLVRPDAPETFFRKGLEDLNKEKLYFGSVLPRAIKTRNRGVRDEFVRTSGLDMIRIEELEREFQNQYQVGDDLMDVIRSTGS